MKFPVLIYAIHNKWRGFHSFRVILFAYSINNDFILVIRMLKRRVSHVMVSLLFLYNSGHSVSSFEISESGVYSCSLHPITVVSKAKLRFNLFGSKFLLTFRQISFYSANNILHTNTLNSFFNFFVYCTFYFHVQRLFSFTTNRFYFPSLRFVIFVIRGS